MDKEIEKEVTKNGPFVGIFINQKGTKFYKGFTSPYLRQQAIRKMKYAGVKSIGTIDYTY
ncbi:MAG TPA: hypothetical protein DCS12_01260 [Clostridiales bacterium]|jgi:hypothetical protein|nr:hypothetical protein [Clostridiales bacterium]